MRGGGYLNRLPIGPGSRSNATGKPAAGFSYDVALDELRKKYTSRVEPAIFEKGTMANDEFKVHLRRLMGSANSTIPRFVYRGIVKPNEYNEKYPIALSFNETLPYIDVKKAIQDDFSKNWDFKYVCGHGVLQPHLKPARVPERTYIRFNSPAGCLAVISGEKTGLPPIMAFPETFSPVMPETLQREKFLNDMTEHFINNNGPLESFNSLEERAEVAANPYSSNFCMRPHNIMSESTHSECMSPLQKKATLYGPGDSVAQMKISFKNNPMQLIMLGMYDLPIPADYYMYVQNMASNIREQSEKDASFNKMLIEGGQKEIDSMTFNSGTDPGSPGIVKMKDEDNRIISISIPNLAKDVIGNTLTLTEVFAALPPVPAGKVRFLFINACRGVPMTRNNVGLLTDRNESKTAMDMRNRQTIGTGFRRASVSGKNANFVERVYRLLEARKIMRNESKSEEERAAAKTIDDEEYTKSQKEYTSNVWDVAVAIEKS